MAKKVRVKARPKRKAPRTTTRTTTTALAKRTAAVPATSTSTGVSRPVGGGDIFDVGMLGLEEVKFTKAEEQILSRAVATKDILIKPTAHPQPYLPHPVYTRWLNEAVGRTGWAIVAIGSPKLSGKSVVAPYVLYIHKKPVAFAWGEQEYHENNREQTYGDALEATVANALRRCCKRLGIGLEMWDKDFLTGWLTQNAVRVQVKRKDGTFESKWRRRTDAPLPFETSGTASRRRDEPPPDQGGRQQEPPPHAHTGRENESINSDQRVRFWTIAKRAHRSEPEIKEWLKKVYHLEHSKDIKQKDYQAMCSKLEASGPLISAPAVSEALVPEVLDADDLQWDLEPGQ